DAESSIAPPAPQVGAVDQSSAAGVQFGDEDVGAGETARLIRANRGGEIGRKGFAGDVGVPRVVYGNSISTVAVSAPQVGAVAEHRIDGQRQPRIVSADLKTHISLIVEHELPRHR